jgi:putative ABC transport system permease protein
MRPLHMLGFRIATLFHRSQMNAEMEEELRSHILHRADDLERSGLPRAEAERRARIEFGGYQKFKEECRETLGMRLLAELMADVRYGSRQLRRNPGFTAVAVVTLALGIGANTAIFSLVKTMLIQPLPIKSASRIVVIWVNNLKAGWRRIGPTGQDYLDWKRQNKSFEDLFLFEHGTGTITGAGEPEQVAGLRVTTNFGEFFGIKPVLGRTFLPDENETQHDLVILAYRYWQQRFGASPSVIGRGLVLNGVPYTVIGVLPPEISALFPVDIIVPFDNNWLKRADSDLGVFGRLKPGVTIAQASSEMNVIMSRIARQRPARKGYGAVLAPLESVRVEYIRPALLVLLVAVGLVLLIACVNVANLLLSRAVGRRREIAVRMAVGAGRMRLVRQFLAESLLLALLGGCAGSLVAVWSTYLLTRCVPSEIPVPNAAYQTLLPKTHMGGVALAFVLIVSLLTGILFGLIPAMQSVRCDVNESLKDGQRNFPVGHRGYGTKATLVILEIALAFVLVIGAGLMLRSLSHLLATNPGFNPDHLLTVRIKLPNDAKNSKYRDPRQQSATFHRFLDRIEALPGVRAAAVTEIVPLSQDDMDMGFFVVAEDPPLPPGVHWAADFRDISPSYFHTMEIPLIKGRTFTEHDTTENPRVVIIDETLARHFFANQDPIEKHLQVPDARWPRREIVGVVGSVLDTGFGQQPRPTVYFPLQQTADQTMSVVVRTTLPTRTILPAIKKAVWSVDRNQPVFNVRTMREIILEITSARHMASLAFDTFGLLALALAIVGVYGVVSHSVAQRIHEIGIRMALGADKGDVLKLILRQGFILAVSGVSFGIVGALVLSRFLSSLLYGVKPTDPLTFAAVSLILTGVALAACYIPARRATKVDPMVALRYE